MTPNALQRIQSANVHLNEAVAQLSAASLILETETSSAVAHKAFKEMLSVGFYLSELERLLSIP